MAKRYCCTGIVEHLQFVQAHAGTYAAFWCPPGGGRRNSRRPRRLTLILLIVLSRMAALGLTLGSRAPDFFLAVKMQLSDLEVANPPDDPAAMGFIS